MPTPFCKPQKNELSFEGTSGCAHFPDHRSVLNAIALLVQHCISLRHELSKVQRLAIHLSRFHILIDHIKVQNFVCRHFNEIVEMVLKFYS